MLRHLPNIITCLNAFIGCIALTVAFRAASPEELLPVLYLLLLAALFDFADGLAARALKAYSVIGKDLDSLADAISFGAVPGAVMYKLLAFTLPENFYWLSYFGFILTVFSILRLAVFNNDQRQSDRFFGVPTPINALTIASIPSVLIQFPERIETICLSFIFVAITLALSLLLVSNLPLLALKFKNVSWSDNKPRFLLITASMAALALLNTTAIPVIFIIYITISLLNREG